MTASTTRRTAPVAPVAPAPVTPTEPTQEAPPEDTAPSGGTEFDPEQYESTPQGPPDTESPPEG